MRPSACGSTAPIANGVVAGATGAGKTVTVGNSIGREMMRGVLGGGETALGPFPSQIPSFGLFSRRLLTWVAASSASGAPSGTSPLK